MTTAGNAPLKVRLREDFRTACDEKAARTGTDLSKVVRNLLTEWLTQQEENEMTDTTSAPVSAEVFKCNAPECTEEFGTRFDLSKHNAEHAPYKGQPATIHLQNDSLPAVVVRVNAKSIAVQRVEIIEGTRERWNDEREPYPAYVEYGDPTKVVPDSTPERYSIIERRDGSKAYRNGSISVSIGRCVRVTDYRY